MHDDQMDAFPRGITVTKEGGELKIKRRWMRTTGLLVVVVGSAMIFFTLTGVGARYEGLLDEFTILSLIQLAFILVVFYFGLTELVNTTTITVGQGTLDFRHRPLPWIGNHRVVAGDLKQLYCKERTHRTRNGERYTYEVHAQLEAGGDIKLLAGLPDGQQAVFIEGEIEEYLGIKDEHVYGAFG